MRLVEGNHLIQQFTPATTDPPLGTPFCQGNRWQFVRMDVHGANRAGHFDAKLGIVVERNWVVGSWGRLLLTVARSMRWLDDA